MTSPLHIRLPLSRLRLEAREPLLVTIPLRRVPSSSLSSCLKGCASDSLLLASNNKIRPSKPQKTESSLFCDACKLNGSLVNCSKCPRAYHMHCLNPPLESYQNQNFVCLQCSVPKFKTTVPRNGDYARYVFDALVDSLKTQNVVIFHLPKHITLYFDSLGNPQQPYKLLSFARLKKKNGKFPARLLTRLLNSDGTAVLCYACGGSSWGKRPLLSCDFCPLNFHLDCLDPPLTCPPNLSIKWKCPCHCDWDLPVLRNSNLFFSRNQILDINFSTCEHKIVQEFLSHV